MKDIQDNTDGYHTYRELYEHRYALFLNYIKYHVSAWKSKLHDDGSMYGGEFIAGIDTPKGRVVYHLPLRLWDKCKVTELEKAPEWDGSTAQDTVDRLYSLLD